MSLSSLSFFAMVIVAVIVYYVLPQKYRWVAVISANLYFLYNCCTLLGLAIWGVTAAITYVATVVASKSSNDKAKKAVTLIAVVALAGSLILLKDSSFFGIMLTIPSPIGISYYTLTWISYVLDVYWGMCKAELNPLKFVAFAGYFPVMSQGPIIRYKECGTDITRGNKFEFKNITNGTTRVLWGLMKKLIIADRISALVDIVYAWPEVYSGLYIWIASVCFTIQLYTDFSGCADIAIGVAEMFGAKIPENFDLPFISQTLEEFWRRWHITLGGWLRDYVLYPVLKSGLWQKLGKVTKKFFGKKYGKKVTTWMGLMVSWFLVGFWHGGRWNYIFGVGIMFGIIIILGDALAPAFNKLIRILHINTDAFSWKLFRIVRTWFFFNLGLVFFRSGGLKFALRNIKLAVSVFNLWILFDGSLYKLGLDVTDYHILLVFMIVIIVAGLLRHFTGRTVRELLNEQNLVFRWILMLILIYSIVIYGCYGEGFDSASFIYQGF